MICLNVEQGSDDWFKARLGIPTASEFDKIVTTKGEPSKQAQKYLYQLAGEKVSGFKDEPYTNAAMLRGSQLEAEAKEFYTLTQEVDIEEVGFCFMDEKRKFGCSPDGLVGEDGLIEIKCPLVSTHVGYLLDGGLPTEYFQQVQGQLFVTGRKWTDFISYFPGLKPLKIRVFRDEAFISKLRDALNSFCLELDEVVKQISNA